MKNNKEKCLIVLSHLMDKNGQLKAESISRLNKALEVMRADSYSKIMFIGWDYRDDSSLSIAKAMFAYASENYNINENQVVLEETSRDTVGDAIFSKIYLRQKEFSKDVGVVTSGYHLKRSQSIFEYVYGESWNIRLYKANEINSDQLAKSEHSSTLAFENTFAGIVRGDDQEILKRLLRSHPYYNGEVYEKPDLSSLLNLYS